MTNHRSVPKSLFQHRTTFGVLKCSWPSRFAHDAYHPADVKKMRHQALLIVLLGACCGLALATIELNQTIKHDHEVGSSAVNLASLQLKANSSNAAGNSKLTLWPLDWVDLTMFIVIGVCLSLAGGAGIGGGAILVPIYIMLRGWPTNIAVAMSNVTVLGGSFANFLCNVNRHRQNGARTIDWELILMMEPTTIAGALFGAMLNKLLPNYIITYLLTAMLTFMAIRLYHKGCEAYAKETKLLKAAKHAAKAAARHAAQDQTHSHHHHHHHQQQQQQQQLLQPDAVRSTSVAIRTRSSNSFSSSSPRSVARTWSRTVSRSISRLSGPMILQAADSKHRCESPSPRAGSFSRAQLHAAIASSASYSSRHGSVLRVAYPEPAAHPTAAPTAAAVAAVLTEESDDHAVGVQLHGHGIHAVRGQLVDSFDVSTLCQGDIVGDTIEPLVVLPLQATSSSASDESHRSLSDDSAEESNYFDVEAADGDGNELSRPLLAHAAGGVSDADVHVSDAAVHVSDVVSGRRDVLDHSIPVKSWPVAAVGAAQVAAVKPAVHQEPCIPVPHLLALLALSAWVVAADTVQHSTRCGSWQYWAVTLSVLAPVVVILLVFRHALLRKYNHDDLAPGAVLPEGQLHWTRKTTLLYPVLCSSAGLIAGLFGIGGGVVKGPLMLELGVPADVAAATSATMIMFTAGSACVVYSRFGQILLDYGAVLAVFGFCTTLCSQLLTFVLIRLLGRRSVIVFMMVTLMGIACGIMYLQSVLETREIVLHPEELTRFGHLCPGGGAGMGYMLNQLALTLRG